MDVPYCYATAIWEGDIIECGSHQDLLEQKGIYTPLIEIQSGYEKKPVILRKLYQTLP